MPAESPAGFDWVELDFGSYGPWGTGMFEKATGELDVRGTMWLTHPDPVNKVEFTFKGKICGIQ